MIACRGKAGANVTAIAVIAALNWFGATKAKTQEQPFNRQPDKTASVAPPLLENSTAVARQLSCPAPPACENNSKYCFDAGPFSATIVQVTDGEQGNYKIFRLNVRFVNLTDHPLSLAYHSGSSILGNEFGNTYFGAKAGGGTDTSATGIGTDANGKTDPQFSLAPHGSDSATFTLWGHRSTRHPTSFHYDVTIDEVDVKDLNKVPRQHVLYFGDFETTSRNPAIESEIIDGHNHENILDVTAVAPRQ